MFSCCWFSLFRQLFGHLKYQVSHSPAIFYENIYQKFLALAVYRCDGSDDLVFKCDIKILAATCDEGSLVYLITANSVMSLPCKDADQGWQLSAKNVENDLYSCRYLDADSKGVQISLHEFYRKKKARFFSSIRLSPVSATIACSKEDGTCVKFDFSLQPSSIFYIFFDSGFSVVSLQITQSEMQLSRRFSLWSDLWL